MRVEGTVQDLAISVRPAVMHYQAGWVLVEYMLATLVMVVILFVPMPGGDYSIVEFVMHSIRGFYQHTTYLMALP